MRVAHVSTFDTLGGAARAMSGLHRALIGLGIDSQVLVQEKRGDDPTVIQAPASTILRNHAWRQIADSWPLMFYRKKTVMHWTRGRVGSGAIHALTKMRPDIIHLHWIGRGFFSVREIGALQGPVVWTLHDSWAFTGGCHVPYECTRYRDRCGACPQLGSRRKADTSRATWQLKHGAWKTVNLTIVTPSRWLASCAAASGLLGGRRIEVIPNGVDHRAFFPEDQISAREALGLPKDRALILFGAMHAGVDRNKGLHLLIDALRLRSWDADLVLFGATDLHVADASGLRIHARGPVYDQVELRNLYSAADVLALPSIQENYPNMILESMACGTPVVAFADGGIPEMIEDGKTGLLATSHQPESFATRLAEALSAAPSMRGACRSVVENKSTLERMACEYADLYRSLLP